MEGICKNPQTAAGNCSACQRSQWHHLGHPREAHRPHIGVFDLIIQQDLSEFPKQLELLIGRSCDGCAKLFQLWLGFTVAASDTLLKQFHGHVRMMQQRLLEKRHQDGITPERWHLVQVPVRRFPANLR
jgi:hypothetical protein